MRVAAAILLLLPLARAGDVDPETRRGMDAECRGDWIQAVRAFSRAAAEEPGDTRRALRLRYARERAMAVWKPRLDAFLKEKLHDAAARAVAVMKAIDADNAAAKSAERRLQDMGVAIPEMPSGEDDATHFPNRSAAGRLRAFVALGAPFVRAEKLIDDGIRFLVSTQEREGFWDSSKHGGGEHFDPGVTGLALLALVADGPAALSGARAEAARNAASWLVAEQAEDGRIGSPETHSFMYCTVLATEALAEYALVSGDTGRFRPAIERARDYIVAAQSRGLGWRYEPAGSESDTSLTCRAVCALVRARLAGADPGERPLQDAMAWIDKMTDAAAGQTGYNYPGGLSARPEGKQDTFPADHTQAMTAAGALTTCYAGERRAWLPRLLATIDATPPTARYADMYYWQLAARAFVAARGVVPEHWYLALVDAAGACARPDGGMGAVDVWGEDGGRVYATATTVLALAAPYSEPPASTKGDGSASLFLRSGSCEVVLAANPGVVPSGIYAEPAMKLTAVAHGTIQPWIGSPKVFTDGIKHDRKSYRPLVKGLPFGCLLGRIGPEGKPFRIQSEKEFTLNGHGQLFLLVNDERPEDGSGAWTILISVPR